LFFWRIFIKFCLHVFWIIHCNRHGIKWQRDWLQMFSRISKSNRCSVEFETKIQRIFYYSHRQLMALYKALQFCHFFKN
jgi:hypothetical protein